MIVFEVRGKWSKGDGIFGGVIGGFSPEIGLKNGR
jgi:hypothetical protein